ncbi:MAG: ABC-2 type transporter-domain-containing protein [Benjaminiella poitrasii]|nr:MAG: ABC-2 type transporter-domain-containing protein [Benjaminiella poitrasii]
MSYNQNLPTGGEKGRDPDQHSSDGSTATVYQNGLNNYDIGSHSYGEPSANAVDIEAAKGEYNQLKRELSRVSRNSIHASQMEEGQTKEDEFNLDEFLNGLRSDQNESGHELKHLGLVWKDLTVKGLSANAHTIPTVFSFLQFWKFFGVGVSKEKATILNNLTGNCREGEMLLVLGRPGAGCTSFLKVMANMCGSFTDVDGLVSYGGIDPKTFAKRYRGQVCYNEEEDQHYPTLTTKQTLKFALRMKTPGTRLPNETKNDFVNKVLYLLGNMLGLTKQMNTVVGNAFVRGLSGGERKRLSIAEQMTTSSSINCWDCSTRGLDAASALDYVRSLRIMTDVFKKTTVATLYQASNGIFALFDKVLLLDEGRCLYFGPTSYAKEYFESLGFHCPSRKSTPDFLTGLCNPNEREFKPGFEDTAPRFASDFEKRYYESRIYKEAMDDLAEYESLIEREKPSETFQKAVDQEHQKHANKKHPYTASFFQQVKALTVRQFYLNITDIGALISRYGTILIQSLITASCFFKMSDDGAGAFSRGGALFFAVLFNSFISQSELVNFLMGRPILEKHKQYALYRPSAFYIAQVMLDIPYAIVQVLLFEICAYFMMGLRLTAGAFFTFFIFLFFINMCMNGFFRFFGATTSSFFLATQVSGVILIAVTNYTGYTLPWSKMHPWLFWIFWINPLTYGYKGLLINELSGLEYSCEGPGNAVPYGPGYDDWNYKVCTMAGGHPGENFVRGDDYLNDYLDYNPSHIWAPNFVAIVGFFLLFTIMTAGAMELVGLSKASTLTKLYLPGKAPKPRTDTEEEERRRKQANINENIESVSNGTTFSWQNMNYTVPVKGGHLQLLNNVCGIVRPGHLTALMGSSGAGKTTLLDVLARRKTIGKVEGHIYLNNEALMRDFERITGYCEQMDVHQPAVTVREALRFSAYLRQPADVPKEEKDKYVETILQLLEMEDIGDAQIGQVETGFGISVEERKRLTIGVELVGKPKLLFLDEPTSGLDAQSSYNIIRFIRKLADSGWPVLCTIHQPSAVLFEHFDHILLLVRGGRTAYYGEIGKDSRIMIDYFERNGAPKCSPDANPAEYILECVGAGTAGKAKADWANIWEDSAESKALDDELEEVHNSADPNPTRPAQTYATNFATQFKLVYKRMALAYWRSPDYNVGRLLNVMFTSLITGFTFWKLGNSSTDLQFKIFALFGTFIMAMTLIILAQPRFITERLYFRREYASRYYSWLPFALSAILVELPYIFFFAACFMGGFYWTAGMNNNPESCGYFYITFSLLVCWAVSLGFVIAAFSESPLMAAVINPLVVSLLILFAGLMQPPSQMPHFWSSWMYWLDPFHYYIEGLTVNELWNLQVRCTDEDLLKFSPPPGQTCGQYLEPYFSYGATGYVDNPDATQPEMCGYCTYKNGPEFYENGFDWSVAHRWRNFGILCGFFVFNIIVFIFLVFLRRKQKR